MKIIVSDANILIDLANLNLLQKFVELDFEFHTNDFIINEIKNPEQSPKIDKLVESKKIFVAETKVDEYGEILDLQTKNLSVSDCSVLYYTKKINGLLLTGDKNLRKTANKKKIEIRGIFFIFDELVKAEMLTYKNAIVKIKLLQKINNRLPQNEIEKRINKWSK